MWYYWLSLRVDEYWRATKIVLVAELVDVDVIVSRRYRQQKEVGRTKKLEADIVKLQWMDQRVN